MSTESVTLRVIQLFWTSFNWDQCKQVLIRKLQKFTKMLMLFIMLISKVVPVWEFPKMTSREFPGIPRFSGKTRAGNGKKHIEIFAPKLQHHF